MSGIALTPPTGLLRVGARLMVAIAVAVAALMVTAPAGNAIPESTIQAECDKAGGTYTTTIADGKRYSRCCYQDINNKKHCDYYADGTYTHTNFTDPSPTPPTSQPPGEGVVGPPATVVEPTPQPPPRPGNVVAPPATAVQPTPQPPPRPGVILGPMASVVSPR